MKLRRPWSTGKYAGKIKNAKIFYKHMEKEDNKRTEKMNDRNPKRKKSVRNRN